LHKELSNKLSAISSSIAMNQLVTEDLEEFVSHWLLIHIATVDRKLADYCLVNGKYEHGNLVKN
jgi:hemerythrin